MISIVPSIAESAPARTDSWNGSHFISENMHFNAHDRSNRELYASARGSLCKQWHEDSIAPDRNGSKHPGFKPYYPHVGPALGESISPMDFQDEYEKFLEQRPWIQQRDPLATHPHRKLEMTFERIEGKQMLVFTIVRDAEETDRTLAGFANAFRPWIKAIPRSGVLRSRQYHGVWYTRIRVRRARSCNPGGQAWRVRHSAFRYRQRIRDSSHLVP